MVTLKVTDWACYQLRRGAQEGFFKRITVWPTKEERDYQAYYAFPDSNAVPDYCPFCGVKLKRGVAQCLKLEYLD